MNDLSYYFMLNISEDADVATIKKAYRDQISALHPDRASVNTMPMSILINRAYETLIDPVKRAKYDASLKAPTFHDVAPEDEDEDEGEDAEWGEIVEDEPEPIPEPEPAPVPHPKPTPAPVREVDPKSWNVKENLGRETGWVVFCISLIAVVLLAAGQYFLTLHFGADRGWRIAAIVGVIILLWASLLKWRGKKLSPRTMPPLTMFVSYGLIIAGWVGTGMNTSVLDKIGDWFLVIGGTQIVLIAVFSILLRNAAIDLNARQHPGQAAFTAEDTKTWCLGEAIDDNTRQWFAQFQTPGTRLIHDIDCRNGTVATNVLYNGRSAVIVNFANLLPGHYLWTGRGLVRRGQEQIVVIPALDIRAPAISAIGRFARTSTVYITPNAHIQGTPPRGVWVGSYEEAPLVIDHLLDGPSRGNVSRHRMRELYQNAL